MWHYMNYAAVSWFTTVSVIYYDIAMRVSAGHMIYNDIARIVSAGHLI